MMKFVAWTFLVTSLIGCLLFLGWLLDLDFNRPMMSRVEDLMEAKWPPPEKVVHKLEEWQPNFPTGRT